jgi:hypothetical protein
LVASSVTHLRSIVPAFGWANHNRKAFGQVLKIISLSQSSTALQQAGFFLSQKKQVRRIEIQRLGGLTFTTRTDNLYPANWV